MSADQSRLDSGRIVIAIATYKRPEPLTRLLRSLANLDVGKRNVEFVIVDNDPEGSAHETVHHELPQASYAIEPTPGIAAARNKTLSLAGNAAAVAFIDDDEEASAEWLRELVDAAIRYEADVVAGPVDPILPRSAPWWVHRGNWFGRPKFENGSVVKWPATNNSLVTSRALALLNGDYFSEGFSLTGGGDGELFWRLRKAGARMVWSNQAVVSEIVPPSRARASWLWRRGVRLGNVSGRLLVRERSRPVVVLIGLGRVVFGLLTGPISFVFDPEHSASRLFNIPKGVGTISSVFGLYVVEYRRVKP